MTGNGHFGNWRVHSRKATMDDLKDPKKACSQMLSYLQKNEDNESVRDYSGIRVITEAVQVKKGPRQIAVTFYRPLDGDYFGDPDINQSLVPGFTYNALLNFERVYESKNQQWGCKTYDETIQFRVLESKAFMIKYSIGLIGALFYLMN